MQKCWKSRLWDQSFVENLRSIETAAETCVWKHWLPWIYWLETYMVSVTNFSGISGINSLYTDVLYTYLFMVTSRYLFAETRVTEVEHLNFDSRLVVEPHFACVVLQMKVTVLWPIPMSRLSLAGLLPIVIRILCRFIIVTFRRILLYKRSASILLRRFYADCTGLLLDWIDMIH